MCRQYRPFSRCRVDQKAKPFLPWGAVLGSHARPLSPAGRVSWDPCSTPVCVLSREKRNKKPRPNIMGPKSKWNSDDNK